MAQSTPETTMPPSPSSKPAPKDIRKPTTSSTPTTSATTTTITTASHTSHSADIVPLDSPSRTQPIHPSLPTIKMPADHATSNINPVTLQPFSDADLKSLGYEKLRSEYENAGNGNSNSDGNGDGTAALSSANHQTSLSSPTNINGSTTTPGGNVAAGGKGVNVNEITKAREDAVKMLRERIAEREAKEREIDRDIDEKEKIREVERKVYRKKMGVGEGKAGKDGD